MTEALSFFLDEVIAPFFTEFLPKAFNETVVYFNETIAEFSTAPFETIFSLVVTSFFLLMALSMIYLLAVDIPLRLFRGLLWITGNNIGRAKKYTDNEVKQVEVKISEERRELVKYLIGTTITPESITVSDKAHNAIKLLQYRSTQPQNFKIPPFLRLTYLERWRLQYPKTLKDAEDYNQRDRFENIDFSQKNAMGVFAHKAIFRNCKFNGASISGSMREVDFINTSFKEAVMNATDFSMANLDRANFAEAKVAQYTRFMAATLTNVNFSGLFSSYNRVLWQIERINLTQENGEDVDEAQVYEQAKNQALISLRKELHICRDKNTYWGMNYSVQFKKYKYTFFMNANICNSNFFNSHLIEANFYKSYGRDIRFHRSNIIGSIFAKVYFSQPSFQGTNIENSMFNQATLNHADFSNAFCKHVSFENFIGSEPLYKEMLEGVGYITRWRRFRLFSTFDHIQRASLRWFVKALREKSIQCKKFLTSALRFHRTIVTYANFNDSVFERCRFKYVNLEGSTFHNAKMQECSFWFCNFRGCDLTNAKFINCKGLSVRQLSKAKTLKDAQLPDKLRLPLQKRFPHLFV